MCHLLRTRNLIFILLITFPIMANGRQPGKGTKQIVVQDVTFVDFVDHVPPPPQHLTTTFKTLQDWLFNICDSKAPDKQIQCYSFGVMGFSDQKILYLVGQNTYNKEKHSRVCIAFEPPNMYFPLPKSEYDNLSSEQIADKLLPELTDFVKTEKFKASFLAKA